MFHFKLTAGTFSLASLATLTLINQGIKQHISRLYYSMTNYRTCNQCCYVYFSNLVNGLNTKVANGLDRERLHQ